MLSAVGNKKLTNTNTKERKIFLNSMNSWFSNFVIEALRTETITDPRIVRNEFMGTKINDSNMKLPHLFEPTETKIDFNYHFEHEVFKNDFFIYNLEDSDYSEIEYLIKGLKTLKHTSEKYLLVISSIMTWARTPKKVKKEKVDDDVEGELSEDEEIQEEIDDNIEKDENNLKDPTENIKKYVAFKDRDYITRIPSKKYYQNKMIETLALAAANTNPMLKTYIICPGLIYGCGEDVFYEYFKMAWLIEPFKLPIIGDGKNSIPTIHILDLVNLIKRIIERKPNLQNKYILAVDRTKNSSLKNIITSISKSTGSGEVENIIDFSDNSKKNIPSPNELSINLKCKTSKIFDDQKENEEDEEEFLKKTFKWHCEFGIPENLEKIRNEFTSYRNLKSVKIFITGLPASGKSSLSDFLKKHYNIPHITILDLVEYGKNLPQSDELGEEIKIKIEELRDKAIEEWEESQKKVKGKKKADPPDRSTINPRLPDEIISKILKRKLKENMCRNRGYILDGYPRGYSDAKLAFSEINNQTDDESIIFEEFTPNSIIRLDNTSDEFLKNRIKNNPYLSNSRYNEETLTRRINTYRNLNESIIGDLSLSDFLKKKVEILQIDAKLTQDEILMKSKIFLERNGPILNYQEYDQSDEIEHKKQYEEKILTEKKNKNKESDENEFYENQRQEDKKVFNENELQDLKDRERKLLEQKSEVLRRYLHENVIPILSKGIIEVCKELPNDPVDFLADFLFENSMKVKFPPNKYHDD